ncbi:MAG TPA: glycosyltransferase family 4 protein [Terriglobales bacterium]|nr:glycosyltransferase family 4 protein [Terriglobales bacterium]
MRITFILPGWAKSPVGGFKVVYEYANRLSEKGHQVNVIHPRSPFFREVKFKHKMKMFANEIASHFLQRNKMDWFTISPNVNMLIVNSLEERNIPEGDAIIATAWQTAEWVNKYSQDKGNKFYLIQHYEIWSGPEERIKATWKMPLKKIVISRWLKELAEEMGEEIIAYIPNGIDFKHFNIRVPIDKREPAKITMLYDPSSWKGPEEGIAALNMVKSKIPSLSAIFFSKYTKGPEVPGWVEFYKNPLQEEIPQIYNSCSIFLHSSRSEGWGLPPAEAMACGCALVASNSQGVLEYAIHQETALVSDIKNSAALAQNILKLIRDNELRISLAKRGNQYIQRFTWEKAVSKFEEVIISTKRHLKS